MAITGSLMKGYQRGINGSGNRIKAGLNGIYLRVIQDIRLIAAIYHWNIAIPPETIEADWSINVSVNYGTIGSDIGLPPVWGRYINWVEDS